MYPSVHEMLLVYFLLMIFLISLKLGSSSVLEHVIITLTSDVKKNKEVNIIDPNSDSQNIEKLPRFLHRGKL